LWAFVPGLTGGVSPPLESILIGIGVCLCQYLSENVIKLLPSKYARDGNLFRPIYILYSRYTGSDAYAL